MPIVNLTTPIPGTKAATKYRLEEIVLNFDTQVYAVEVALISAANEVVQTTHINGPISELSMSPGIEPALTAEMTQVLKTKGVIN